MKNGDAKLLQKVLADDDTPEWGRAILLVLLEDHHLLREHLKSHDAIRAQLLKILVPVMVALLIPIVFAVLQWIGTIV